jgi:hypothetical protein
MIAAEWYRVAQARGGLLALDVALNLWPRLVDGWGLECREDKTEACALVDLVYACIDRPVASLRYDRIPWYGRCGSDRGYSEVGKSWGSRAAGKESILPYLPAYSMFPERVPPEL